MFGWHRFNQRGFLGSPPPGWFQDFIPCRADPTVFSWLARCQTWPVVEIHQATVVFPMGFLFGDMKNLWFFPNGTPWDWQMQARMHRRTVSKSMFIVFALALCVDCHGIKWHWDLCIQCPILTSANQTRLAGKNTIYFRDSSGILQPPLMTPEGTPSHEIMTNPSFTVLRCIKPVWTRG